MSLICAMWWML